MATVNFILPEITPDVALRCPKEGGTFRAKKVGDKCPSCGEPGVSADTKVALPVRPTAVPAAMAEDAILTKLREREVMLPVEIRNLEARLVELKAQRKQAAEAIGTLKVRVSIGVAKQADLERATDSLGEIDAEIRQTEDAMDVAVASQRAVVEQIELRTATLRDASKPALMAAARKFRDAISVHLDAIETLIQEADAIGADHEPIFHRDWMINGRARTHDQEAALAIGVLRHLASGRRGSKPILDLVARFREHASRL